MERLPNELLDRIAFYSSLQDLKLFSLTCHRIRSVSIRHIFRGIKLTYGLSDEELQEPAECYSCYVQMARHVRDIHLCLESKSFYHYNVQGCHGNIIRDALMPFNQVERLGLFEYSETSWATFFSVLKRQLETKPKLKYLSLQPNFGERAKEPRNLLKETKDNWLRGPLPKLQTLRLSFFAMDRRVRGVELDRVIQFIEIVGWLGRVTDGIHTLILDGVLRIESAKSPPLTSRPLVFPQLRTLLIRDLRMSGASISDLVALETLRDVRAISIGRPESWGTDHGILERFLPFPNLREVHLYHNHSYFRCSSCKDSHRIFHIGITPAFEDSKILAKQLPNLEVVKWYSAHVPPLLLRYTITRNNDGSVNLALKRSEFKKVPEQDGWECSDYHGKYPNLEVLPGGDERYPPRINWQDLPWFEPSESS
ncbi:hypothetical protein TWF730_010512 [Orbilia blumenaviensis]|uniref:F-box domain-containing protein n=1 Tax=Orbilia blumenaviensis TaxID=1796055 RepID=A0AAV9UNE9_9PEZI